MTYPKIQHKANQLKAEIAMNPKDGLRSLLVFIENYAILVPIWVINKFMKGFSLPIKNIALKSDKVKF